MQHSDFIKKASLTSEGLQLLEDYKLAFKHWKPLAKKQHEIPKHMMHEAQQKIKGCGIRLWTVANRLGVTHEGFMGIIKHLEDEAL